MATILHRIRLAMQTGSFKKLSGGVEVDETYIGGKARNMHKSAQGHVCQHRAVSYLRYLDEEVFHFNNRKVKDSDRFVKVMQSVAGKRLTYRNLTGKDLPTAS